MTGVNHRFVDNETQIDPGSFEFCNVLSGYLFISLCTIRALHTDKLIVIITKYLISYVSTKK